MEERKEGKGGRAGKGSKEGVKDEGWQDCKQILSPGRGSMYRKGEGKGWEGKNGEREDNLYVETKEGKRGECQRENVKGCEGEEEDTDAGKEGKGSAIEGDREGAEEGKEGRGSLLKTRVRGSQGCRGRKELYEPHFLLFHSFLITSHPHFIITYYHI